MGIRPLQPYSVLLPSHMRRQEGFTLPEILVAIVILGILTASSLPAYRTYQQRAYVSEASLMLRQILTNQVGHFLEYEKFYPNDGQAMSIFHDDPDSHTEMQALKRALGVTIPGNHLLDYYIQAFPDTADDFCVVMVSAPFPLFTDGSSQVIGLLDRDGRLLVSSDLPLPDGKKAKKEKNKAKGKKEKL